jgi:hypothetical protein
VDVPAGLGKTAMAVLNDIDIDRFIRDVENSDAQVFWRAYGGSPNETDDTGADPAGKGATP